MPKDEATIRFKIFQDKPTNFATFKHLNKIFPL